jgi:hypothetical protein
VWERNDQRRKIGVGLALTKRRSSFSFAWSRTSRPAASFAHSLVRLVTMSDSSDRTDAVSSTAAARLRTYLDEDGQVWHVTEQPFSAYDRRQGRSLIFASDLAVRRVRNYPSDWFILSDQALAALSWKVWPRRIGERATRVRSPAIAGVRRRITEAWLAHREFADAHGVRWQVWAVNPSSAERRDVPERRTDARATRSRRVRQELRIRMEEGLAHGWLVFESANEKRRMRPIPDGWSERTDEELAALLHEAVRAPQTSRRLIE